MRRSPVAHTLSRGEIWLGDFDPVVGHEQAGVRPGLIVSSDAFHATGAELVVVVPLTTRGRRYPSHIAVPAGSTGLDHPSFALTDQVRSLSTQRLLRYIGRVDKRTMADVEMGFRLILGLL